jgi:hypothetical protein
MQPVDDAGDTRQAQFAGGELQMGLRHANVQALVDGLLCRLRLVARVLRQVRQPLGQLQLAGLGLVEPEGAHQRLARTQRRLLRTRELGDRFRGERLFAGALQLVEVACRLHAARQLGAGICRGPDLFGVPDLLLRGDRAHPVLARVGGRLDHIARQAQPDLLLLEIGHSLPRGQQQQVDHRHAQHAADVEVPLAALAAHQPLEGEDRVGQPGALRGLSRRGGTLEEGRLQRRAVGQRKAHGVVRAQWLGQCRFDVPGGLLARLVRAQPGQLGAEVGFGDRVDILEIAVDRRAGAARQQRDGQRNDGPADPAWKGIAPNAHAGSPWSVVVGVARLRLGNGRRRGLCGAGSRSRRGARGAVTRVRAGHLRGIGPPTADPRDPFVGGFPILRRLVGEAPVAREDGLIAACAGVPGRGGGGMRRRAGRARHRVAGMLREGGQGQRPRGRGDANQHNFPRPSPPRVGRMRRRVPPRMRGQGQAVDRLCARGSGFMRPRPASHTANVVRRGRVEEGARGRW